MHECKAFACQVRAGRLNNGTAPQPTKNAVLWPTTEPIPDTPTAAQPEGKFRHAQ
jgi:hypothetical protein